MSTLLPMFYITKKKKKKKRLPSLYFQNQLIWRHGGMIFLNTPGVMATKSSFDKPCR